MSQPEPSPFPGDAVPDASFNVALAAMVDRDFLATEKHRRQGWRAIREGAHPDILEFEKAFIKRARGIGIPIMATEIIRTPERQTDLYALGVTKARAGQSPHQYGCAVDLVHGVKAWQLSDKQWHLLGHLGAEVARAKGLKMTWGGSKAFGFFDPAHWQLEFWKSIKEDYPWQAD